MDNLAWGYPQIRMVHTHLALFLTSVLLLLHQQRAAAVAAAPPAQLSHSLSPSYPLSRDRQHATSQESDGASPERMLLVPQHR